MIDGTVSQTARTQRTQTCEGERGGEGGEAILGIKLLTSSESELLEKASTLG